MSNELLLIVSVVCLYSGVVLFYRYFGKTGLYCWNIFATICANIEVLIVVDAFGMEQTLGNVLFATTFLVTDILSEKHGKKEAQRAVTISIAASIVFIIISQSWLLYTPNSSDLMASHIGKVFSFTPRIVLSSILVYAVVQYFDVFAYHFIWKITTKHCNDSKRFLWLRNNLATMLSQLINTFLYTFLAFYGMYSFKTLMNLVFSTFIIYIFTSLLDTPAIYIARSIKPKDWK